MTLRRRPAAAAALVGAVAVASLWAGATAGVAATTAVEVSDHAYTPAAIEVAVGDTVRWTWVGREPHSVTAPGTFDSHPRCTPLTPDQCGRAGASFAWTAAEVGTVDYGCRIHPDRMRGSITVVAAPSPRPSPSSSPPPPAAEPSPAPPPPPASSPSPPAEEPGPSPAPSPEPTRRSAPSFGVGEATEVSPSPTPAGERDGVAPPVLSGPSPEPLEPFPAPPSPSRGPEPLVDDVVAVGSPGGGGRTAVRVAAALAVLTSLVTFGRVVLFGRPWV